MATGEWIEWKGGECPVDPNSRPMYRMRGGGKESCDVLAKHLTWQHIGGASWEIVAYKVLP